MNRIKAPPIKMQGIKTKIVPHIRTSIDWHGRGRWVEPFVGSATVLFNINPDRAILGDTNVHLIHFYKAIQKNEITTNSVRAFLEREGKYLMFDGEEHYYWVRERFNCNHDPHDFLFLNRSCFNGLMRFNKKGEFNTPFCRKPERFSGAYITKICNQVQWVADRMHGKDWEFVCSDWSDVIKVVHDEDFVYADPPYAGRFTDYFNSWSDEDASRLEDRLKGLPCPFLYSMWSQNKYRRNDRLHQAFSSYEIKLIPHFYHLGSTEGLRNKMAEALISG